MGIKVVLALAGREKGRLMAVVGQNAQGMLLCDGKERPLTRPKLKNPKHAAQTNYEIEESALLSDRALRRALKCLRAKSEEEFICQKKI